MSVGDFVETASGKTLTFDDSKLTISEVRQKIQEELGIRADHQKLYQDLEVLIGDEDSFKNVGDFPEGTTLRLEAPKGGLGGLTRK